jgi:hypothetical protein
LFDHGNSSDALPTDPAALIAARWADHCKVPQTAFKPDWTKHAMAAPFKRNDQMLDVLQIGVLVSPAPASRRTWPTKRESSASRCGNSVTAARKRRITSLAFARNRDPRGHRHSKRQENSSLAWCHLIWPHLLWPETGLANRIP